MNAVTTRWHIRECKTYGADCLEWPKHIRDQCDDEDCEERHVWITARPEG